MTTETLADIGNRDAEDAAVVLTVAETMALLRSSRTTVWRLIRDGDLVAFRIGSRVRVPVSGVERFLVERRIGAPHDE